MLALSLFLLVGLCRPFSPPHRAPTQPHKMWENSIPYLDTDGNLINRGHMFGPHVPYTDGWLGRRCKRCGYIQFYGPKKGGTYTALEKLPWSCRGRWSVHGADVVDEAVAGGEEEEDGYEEEEEEEDEEEEEKDKEKEKEKEDEEDA
ncbi:hypothetical protein B484DRAFT_392441 [Ochromonadaceae sp. CCMP2298]|nr:hypothetical protein B484DRAFT_392441 [Ochromonadaceae sp. CCMP2298]